MAEQHAPQDAAAVIAEVRTIIAPYHWTVAIEKAKVLALCALAERWVLNMEVPSLNEQIDQLAQFILAEIPGEPSQSQGAIDTAIRVMRAQQARCVALEAALEKARPLLGVASVRMATNHASYDALLDGMAIIDAALAAAAKSGEPPR